MKKIVSRFHLQNKNFVWFKDRPDLANRMAEMKSLDENVLGVENHETSTSADAERRFRESFVPVVDVSDQNAIPEILAKLPGANALEKYKNIESIPNLLDWKGENLSSNFVNIFSGELAPYWKGKLNLSKADLKFLGEKGFSFDISEDDKLLAYGQNDFLPYGVFDNFAEFFARKDAEEVGEVSEADAKFRQMFDRQIAANSPAETTQKLQRILSRIPGNNPLSKYQQLKSYRGLWDMSGNNLKQSFIDMFDGRFDANWGNVKMRAQDLNLLNKAHYSFRLDRQSGHLNVSKSLFGDEYSQLPFGVFKNFAEFFAGQEVVNVDLEGIDTNEKAKQKLQEFFAEIISDNDRAANYRKLQSRLPGRNDLERYQNLKKYKGLWGWYDGDELRTGFKNMFDSRFDSFWSNGALQASQLKYLSDNKFTFLPEDGKLAAYRDVVDGDPNWFAEGYYDSFSDFFAGKVIELDSGQETLTESQATEKLKHLFEDVISDAKIAENFQLLQERLPGNTDKERLKNLQKYRGLWDVFGSELKTSFVHMFDRKFDPFWPEKLTSSNLKKLSDPMFANYSFDVRVNRVVVYQGLTGYAEYDTLNDFFSDSEAFTNPLDKKYAEINIDGPAPGKVDIVPDVQNSLAYDVVKKELMRALRVNDRAWDFMKKVPKDDWLYYRNNSQFTSGVWAEFRAKTGSNNQFLDTFLRSDYGQRFLDGGYADLESFLNYEASDEFKFHQIIDRMKFSYEGYEMSDVTNYFGWNEMRVNDVFEHIKHHTAPRGMQEKMQELRKYLKNPQVQHFLFQLDGKDAEIPELNERTQGDPKMRKDLGNSTAWLGYGNFGELSVDLLRVIGECPYYVQLRNVDKSSMTFDLVGDSEATFIDKATGETLGNFRFNTLKQLKERIKDAGDPDLPFKKDLNDIKFKNSTWLKMTSKPGEPAMYVNEWIDLVASGKKSVETDGWLWDTKGPDLAHEVNELEELLSDTKVQNFLRQLDGRFSEIPAPVPTGPNRTIKIKGDPFVETELGSYNYLSGLGGSGELDFDVLRVVRDCPYNIQLTRVRKSGFWASRVSSGFTMQANLLYDNGDPVMQKTFDTFEQLGEFLSTLD